MGATSSWGQSGIRARTASIALCAWSLSFSSGHGEPSPAEVDERDHRLEEHVVDLELPQRLAELLLVDRRLPALALLAQRATP